MSSSINLSSPYPYNERWGMVCKWHFCRIICDVTHFFLYLCAEFQEKGIEGGLLEHGESDGNDFAGDDSGHRLRGWESRLHERGV